VAPDTTEALAGDTITVVTTGGAAVTVIVAAPVLPEDVAVIVAEPAATAVTTPLALTVAIEALLVDQVTVCPVIVFPFWSFTVALTEAVPPTTTELLAGETVTVVATGVGGGGVGAVTVIDAVPLFVPLVPVMVAEPAATPVTTPEAFTVAIALFVLDHVTVCPLIGLPF
jgi:hypothetical protein